MGTQHRVISLADLDPELVRGVKPEDRAQLRSVQIAVLTLPPGTWEPKPPSPAAFAVLVLDGMLTREVQVESRTTSCLFGPGDVAEPWTRGGGSVPVECRWIAAPRTVVAVLDARWLLAVRRWPSLQLHLQERLADQTLRHAVQRGVGSLAGVELRVLGQLWHLADRFGSVTGTGVHLPLRLTHEALGRLVGAQRPTVTLALGALEREGLVARRPDGAWILRAGSHRRLAPTTVHAPLEASAATPTEVLPRLVPESDRPSADLRHEDTPVDGEALHALLRDLRESMDHRQQRADNLTRQCRAAVARAQSLRASITEQRERMRLRRESAPSARSLR